MFADIGLEYRGASLGDLRRSARLEAIGERLAQDPSRSFPEAMASEGQLEALYRFLNNDGVSFARILEPHVGMTAERSADHHGSSFYTTRPPLSSPESARDWAVWRRAPAPASFSTLAWR